MRTGLRNPIGFLTAVVALLSLLMACQAAPAIPANRPDGPPAEAPAGAIPPAAAGALPTIPPPALVKAQAVETATPEPTPLPTYAPPLPPGCIGGPLPTPGTFNGQSNLVPVGYPTPNTSRERLSPGGPARDPGPLDWARPGPYLAPNWSDFSIESFGASQRVATTYYYYWHDLTDPARATRYVNGQFNSPPNRSTYSFRFPETHYKEFRDMQDAGLDFVLAVYWGEPGHPGRTTSMTCPDYWSTDGIPPMVEALDRLAAEGRPFKIGLFFDTTILANADLTTPRGKEYFYINIRDFYSRIPPTYWAAIDGKPVVWLYDAIWIAAFDQSTIDYIGERFARDFGGPRPYVVRELQWEVSKHAGPPTPILSEGMYAWGAAPFGFARDPKFTVAQVGPGFTNTAYCTGGPEHNCFDVPRQDGAWYEAQLREAVASPRTILAVETWNEFSEGTDIAESIQQGRKYIDLTRAYADRFKAGGPAP